MSPARPKLLSGELPMSGLKIRQELKITTNTILGGLLIVITIIVTISISILLLIIIIILIIITV